MKKVRIVKRTGPDGTVRFVIQQKHFLFKWLWVDAWINSLSGANCTDSFDSFREADENLCYFDGSKSIDKVVYNSGDQK